MTKGSKKDFDVKAWAKNTGCGKATTANCSKEILEAIHTVLEMKARGDSHVSIMQLHTMLQDKFDYPFGRNALYEYIKRYEKDLWREISGQK